jgi:nucleoside-diphosphate-sugar epimerase
VLHVASPFPSARPEDEDEIIVPARDGALRVLRAARDAGVQRVVLTSSFAAVGYGHGDTSRVFDERDWTDPDGPGVSAYIKSKVLAERAAWDFIEKEGGDLELPESPASPPRSATTPTGPAGPCRRSRQC